MTDFGFSPLTEAEANTYSPLALAFVGDGVYEVYIRARILLQANRSANKLHKDAVAYVKASGQSHAIKTLKPLLTEEEEAIFKRGRNAHSASVPKNADVTEYRAATGFEALIGYLYLTGKKDRLMELMALAWESIEKNI